MFIINTSAGSFRGKSVEHVARREFGNAHAANLSERGSLRPDVNGSYIVRHSPHSAPVVVATVVSIESVYPGLDYGVTA